MLGNQEKYNIADRALNKEVKLLNEEAANRGDIFGVDFPDFDLTDLSIGVEERTEINLPNHSEPEIVRHFTQLSRQNYSIDTGFYPLGSCTMKYNPRINEAVSRFAGFADIHPLQDQSTVQGALQVIYELQGYLSEVTGLHDVSLNPAAGAHGEYTGIRLIKAAHIDNEGDPRKYIIVPDSAHGTNPATAAMCGYKILIVKTNKFGRCSFSDIKSLVEKHGKDIAGIMLTNPNTCGKFESDIVKISDLIHSVGGYFYYDGANLNAILGAVKPADFGVDVMHFNLHKTFSTPHGGGGPGCGPIAMSKKLCKYRPVPYIIKEKETYKFISDDNNSIGQIKGFYGQFALMVRALCYILSNGKEGILQISKDAVLNANYVLASLKDDYHVPYEGYCMHECLLSDKFQKEYDMSTLDIAKAMIEYGIHPMTMYFPLIVSGAMLIEPTETETKETLDNFIMVMKKIANKIKNGQVAELKKFPISSPRSRLDEVKAARDPILTWNFNK
jgi:glycine dehydrogenase subunit 2